MRSGDERETRRVLQGGLRSSRCWWVSVCRAQMPSSGTKHGLGLLGGQCWPGQGQGSAGDTGDTWPVWLCNPTPSVGASEEEYSEFNVKWCNKEVRHEQKVMKHFQGDLGTWDRGQSRAVVSSETLSTTQSEGCCPPLHELTPNSPNPALHSPRHFWVKNKGTQGG